MDDNDILRGKIPWSVEGFKEVNKFLYELLQRPKDDWDLKEDISTLNPLDPIAQVAKYLQKQYTQEYLWKAHLIRYNNIIRFLQDHQSELFQQELLYPNKPIPFIKDKLITLLCEMRFTEEQFTAEGKEFVFSYPDIIERLSL